ncbi:hypothetical protein B0H14DRAFT_3580668 [Mycena olivaceomarginata]|nr:hypothetical protein B0H14DRAFT_3580668 [Mycena olivaceomarginata]
MASALGASARQDVGNDHGRQMVLQDGLGLPLPSDSHSRCRYIYIRQTEDSGHRKMSITMLGVLSNDWPFGEPLVRPDPPDECADETAKISIPVRFEIMDTHLAEYIKRAGAAMAKFPTPDTEPSREQDWASTAEGHTILGPAVLHAYAWLIRSRVLKDAFCQALRAAMLVPHPTDKALIEAYLKTHNVTWENMRRFHPKWLWRHCRRTIPPAEHHYAAVHKVFMTYGPLKDAKTGLPLFNTAAWKIAKIFLELIRNGYVSDPPGVQLYYCLGFDKKAGGLPIYRCVGHLNSTGHKYTGHDSIWLLDEIQELEITLGEHYNILPAQLAWVNGNLYVKTEQTAGINDP